MKRFALILSLVMFAGFASTGAAQDQLFVGTAINPDGTSNDAYLIDVATDTPRSVFTGRAVWGGTYDVSNNRVLFTSDGGVVGGADLYQMPAAGGPPILIGTITDTAGEAFRIDGLAISGGVLYGSRAAANLNGIYSINLGTMVATKVIATYDSISGIDADPATGIIYGVNDSSQMVVTIDPGEGTITPFVAYPDPEETDLDGIGAGGGFFYLVPDDYTPGLIYVYDLAAGSFVTPLTAPWTGSDTFSGGGAVIVQHPATVPTLSVWGLALFAAALLGVSVFCIRRRVFLA